MSRINLALDDAEAAFLEAVLTGTEARGSHDGWGTAGQLAHNPGTLPHNGVRSPTLLATGSGGALVRQPSVPETSSPFPGAVDSPPVPSLEAASVAAPTLCLAAQPPRLQTHPFSAVGGKNPLPQIGTSLVQAAATALARPTPAVPQTMHRQTSHGAPCSRATATPRSTAGATPRSTSRTLSSSSAGSSGTCSGGSRGKCSGGSRGTCSGASGTSVTDGSTGSARRAFAAPAPRPPPVVGSHTDPGAAAAPAPAPLATRAHPLRRARELLQQAVELELELQQFVSGDQPAAAATALGSARGRAVWSAGSTSSAGSQPAPSPLSQQQQQNSRRQSWRPPAAPTAPPLAPAQVDMAQSGMHSLQPTPEAALDALAERLCAAYNSSAVALLEAGLGSEARQQLDKAALLAGSGGPLAGRPGKQRELQAVVHNNFACYFRRLQQPETALEHLTLAAELEAAAAAAPEGVRCAAAGDSLQAAAAGAPRAGHGAKPGPSAATLLNLAACCSSLGRHGQALEYAEQGVTAAARELQVPLAVLESALLEGLVQSQLWEALPQLRHADRAACSQMAMSYYNRAVEQEHLQQWQVALESYRLAVCAASRLVGRGAELTLTVQQSAEAFKARLRRLERQGKMQSSSGGARRSSGGGTGTRQSGGGGGRSVTPTPPTACAPLGHTPRELHQSPASRRLRATSSASAGISPPQAPVVDSGRAEGLPAIRRPASVPASGAFAACAAPTAGVSIAPLATLPSRPSTPSSSLQRSASLHSAWPDSIPRSQLSPQPQNHPASDQEDRGSVNGNDSSAGPMAAAVGAAAKDRLSTVAQREGPAPQLPWTCSSGRGTLLSSPAGPGPPSAATAQSGVTSPTMALQAGEAASRRPGTLVAPLEAGIALAAALSPAGFQAWHGRCSDDADSAVGRASNLPATATPVTASADGPDADATVKRLGTAAQDTGHEVWSCQQPMPRASSSTVPMCRPQASLNDMAPKGATALVERKGSCNSMPEEDAWVAEVRQETVCMLKPKRDGLAV